MRPLAPLTVASLLLASCSTTGPSTEPTSPGATGATSAPPDPSADPSAQPVSTSPPAKAASSFVAVAKLEGVYSLFPLDNALMVADQEAKPWPGSSPDDYSQGNAIGVVEGDSVKFAKEWALQGWFHNIVAAEGSWPDDLTLLAVGDTGRAPTAESYTLKAGKLQATCKGDCPGGARYVGLLKTPSSLVAVDAPFMPFGGAAPKFTTLRGPKVTLKSSPATKTCENAMGEGGASLKMPLAVGSLPDGTILAYGPACEGPRVIEVWKAGSSTSSLTKLEGEPSDAAQFVISKSGDAWLIDGGIHHFEGGAWKPMTAPGGGEVALRGAIAKDGTFHVTTASGLYKRGTDRWEAVELPGDTKPIDIAADKDGVLWVVDGRVLLRQRKSADESPKVADAAVVQQAPPKTKKPASFGGPRCKDNVVILYGFTKVTPDDYDFPLTRKALKGHTELKDVKFVVTKDYGKKFFAAKTPSFEVAKKVSKVIEDGVKGAKPAIVCAQPEVVRELKINLATGDVVK
ncbi:MAG: hypothetical protein IPG04_08525 [Polyangiaceae bacterium]|nr:hypothetical protein [Polyangiaceae bacterium]